LGRYSELREGGGAGTSRVGAVRKIFRKKNRGSVHNKKSFVENNLTRGPRCFATGKKGDGALSKFAEL